MLVNINNVQVQPSRFSANKNNINEKQKTLGGAIARVARLRLQTDRRRVVVSYVIVRPVCFRIVFRVFRTSWEQRVFYLALGAGIGGHARGSFPPVRLHNLLVILPSWYQHIRVRRIDQWFSTSV